MISAVDTNILLDLLSDSPTRGVEARQQLDEAAIAGSVVISEAVYAELAPGFEDSAQLDRFLEETQGRLIPSSREALHLAGSAWQAYSRRRPRILACPQCGEPMPGRCESCGVVVRVRQHVLADFLIGAHALVHADRLLTRDRGYYATYFPDLELA